MRHVVCDEGFNILRRPLEEQAAPDRPPDDRGGGGVARIH